MFKPMVTIEETEQQIVAHTATDLKDYFFTKVKPAIKRALRENGWGDDDPKFYGELEAIYIYPNGKTFSLENRIECSVHKQSNDEDIDLASLQILNGSLPPNVSIVSSAKIQPDETKLQVGAPAYVIGFPYGDALALNEDNELNCTSTQGSFTQAPSKSYVQYSAQTASGGSGSPVFNEFGELVAVTYQGSSSGQSFNRGILNSKIELSITGQTNSQPNTSTQMRLHFVLLKLMPTFAPECVDVFLPLSRDLFPGGAHTSPVQLFLNKN